MPDARRAAPVVGQLTRREGGGPATLLIGGSSRPEKFEEIHFECAGELVDRYDGRVSLSRFQTAYVLLTKAGNLSEALLG
jgi:hypothetical protein